MLLWKDEKREIEKANLELNQKRAKEEDATRLKKFSETLKGAIPRQTNDPLETVAFFRTVEQQFFMITRWILHPETILVRQIKRLMAKMDPDKSRIYKEVKDMILKEYKVSLNVYHDRLNTLTQSDDQTLCHVCFFFTNCTWGQGRGG